MRQAMEQTGIVAPPGKDPECNHQTGKAADGRCIGCKRAADQRTYRKKQYEPALAELVTRGIAERGTGPDGVPVWQYTGPSYGYVPPKLPNLPYECDPRTTEHFRAAYGRAPSRKDGTPGLLDSMMTQQLDMARRGQQYRAEPHDTCSVCQAAYAEGEAAHGDDSPAAVTARTGRRADGHQDCWFCLHIDEAADEARRLAREETERIAREEAEAERVRAERQGRITRYSEAHRDGRYAYVDGRRIRRDGSLCMCSDCDDRQERRRAEAARTGARASYAPGGNTATAGQRFRFIQSDTASNRYTTITSDELNRLRDSFRGGPTPPRAPRWEWEITEEPVASATEGTTDDGDGDDNDGPF